MEENQLSKLAKNDVVRIEKDELALNYIYYPQARDLNNIGVISKEYELPELIKSGYLFSPDSIRPSIGDTYVKDPFNEKRFIRIENFTQEVLRSKQSCIMRIAALLAAKHVELSVSATNVETRNNNLEVDGQYKPVQGQVNIDSEKIKKIAQSFSRTADFKTEFTENGYNQAVQEAKKYGLYNESEVNELLQFRSQENEVNLTNYEIHFIMSNEINSNLDIAAQLNIMKDVFKLSGSFKHSVQTKCTIEGDMKMTF